MDTKLQRGKESSLHILPIRTKSSKRSEIDTLIPASFNGIPNCTQWKKLNHFTFNVFSLFADHDVKTSDLELYLCIVVRYKYLHQNSTFIMGIYLLEKFYYKDIYQKELKVCSDIFNLWAGRSIICWDI